MHVDSVAARRTQAGSPVVHGLHAVLWALDELCRAQLVYGEPSALAVVFKRFLYEDAPARLVVTRTDAETVRAEVHADGVLAVRIDVKRRGPVRSAQPADDAHDRTAQPSAPPAELDLQQIAGTRGEMAVDAIRPASMFPCAAAALGARRTGALAALSTVVGMRCPGLHSIFAGFEIVFEPATDRLEYAATSVDDRFRLVELDVRGGGIRGTVTAFVRHAPVGVDDARIAALVSPDEFAHVAAVVAGASRGLGATTATIVAAGGGRVVATYRIGSEEATQLVRRLGEERCTALRLDAGADVHSALDDVPFPVNQLYYFPTPQIFRRSAAAYDPQRFQDFFRIYADGFAAVARAVRSHAPSGLRVFYPSSTALDEETRELLEYRMAKAAGEVLCREMSRAGSGIHVLVERLPRVRTDQTSTVVPASAADPVDVMLPIVRRMSQTPS